MNFYYDPKTDFLFKKIFGKCKWMTKSLLNSILKLKGKKKISRILYLSPILPLSDDELNCVIDIECTNKEKDIFIVELRMCYSASILRKEFFCKYCELFNKLNKDGILNSSVKKVIMINILDDIYFSNNETKCSFHDFNLSNDNDRNIILSMFQIVHIELPKFNPKAYYRNKMLKLWLTFLTTINGGMDHNRDIPNELLINNTTFEAINICKNLSKKEIEEYKIFWSYHKHAISSL